MNNEKIHDLTMLYLSQQDVSSLTPAQLYVRYKTVFDEIKAESHKNASTAKVG